MISALSSSLAGLQQGMARLDQTALNIARTGTTSNDDDVATNMVNLVEEKTQVKASAAAVKTVDDVLGTLIDTRA